MNKDVLNENVHKIQGVWKKFNHPDFKGIEMKLLT